jgi:c-di-GMP-binding flagellar brake protein YcgR
MSQALQRRRYTRHNLQTVVAYQLGDKRFLTLTANVGLGGMAIETHSRLLRGECIRFRLVLGEELLRVYGTVVYSGERLERCCVSGIQFEGLTAQEQDLLRRSFGLTGVQGFPVP